MTSYLKTPNAEAGLIQNRPVFITPEGGKIATDTALLSLWEHAHGRSLDEVLADYGKNQGVSQDAVRAGLACLAEAGLLQRETAPEGQPLLDLSGPMVSVIIIAFNSRAWLEECLPSIKGQTYSPVETIVVDNGSMDDGADWVESKYPDARVIRLEQQVSFARANRIGVEAALGELIFLLNADVRLAPDALAQAVHTWEGNLNCAAVSTKLKFWWAPSFLNGVGNRVGSFSWGTDNALGHLDLGQFDHWTELPSACYAATLIPRTAWESVGPVDEGFPMYYEDSEWSYRARLLGKSICFAPQSVAYHAFGGRVPSGEDSGLAPRKLRHVVYGRMRFAIKIVGKRLWRFLRTYFLEDWANFTRSLAGRDWETAKAYLDGWRDVLSGLPDLRSERRALQSARVITDDELFGIQRDMPPTLAWHGLPELTWDLVEHYYLPLLRSRRTRSMPEFDPSQRLPHLLIVSNDVVDVKMAGPGMRYLEMARALSKDLDVTLAVPQETTLEIPGIRIVRYWDERPASVEVLVENADVALISGYMVKKFSFLKYTPTRIVVDFYDPIALENLHYYLDEPLANQNALNDQAIDVCMKLAEIGDFFICGNERQRDYWMGILTAAGRVNPLNFTADSSMRSLIDVVSIGFPNREPRHTPLVRGVHPQVPEDARIVLWGGGIWNWLDPLTLIEAWPKVVAAHPEARLVLLGTRHPNPLVPRHEMAARAERLAEEVGEKDRSIIFFEWLSYEERESLLCEADVGVTLHPIHVETRYSLRTRVLDYMWVRLPVLITDGDITSEWVREYNLGCVVPPFDAEAVAQGLVEILNRPKQAWAPAFEPLRNNHTWEKAVQPLLRYCQEGTYAPDRTDREQAAAHGLPSGMARARHILRTEGPRVLLHRVWRFIQWRLNTQ